MTAQIKELKTNRTLSREGMLTYLEDLQKKIKEDEVESLVLIYSDSDSLIKTQVIGDISFTEAIGMIDTAKIAFQMGHFYGEEEDD